VVRSQKLALLGQNRIGKTKVTRDQMGRHRIWVRNGAKNDPRGTGATHQCASTYFQDPRMTMPSRVRMRPPSGNITPYRSAMNHGSISAAQSGFIPYWPASNGGKLQQRIHHPHDGPSSRTEPRRRPCRSVLGVGMRSSQRKIPNPSEDAGPVQHNARNIRARSLSVTKGKFR